MFEVDKDNVPMATFVKSKLGKFENGRAYYELAQNLEEDFLYYKDIVLIPKVRYTLLLYYKFHVNNIVV